MGKVTLLVQPFPKLERKKRVAAYARVSMESEKLLHSLSAQVSYYSALIQKNPQWEYAGVYADEAITGTSIAKRDEFKRLIRDCELGKIDIVLVKSVSRFARDTVDTLNTTRHLKNLGVDVFFERENIHTMTADGELLLTLLASFAQAESRSISENVKWSVRKHFEQGIPNNHKAPYGYRWDGENYITEPEEGMVVKEIYNRYLTGESAYGITKELNRRGIALNESTIKFILQNPSYTGTQRLQKNYISENHKRHKNNGELSMYEVDGVFEQLISAEDYYKASKIMQTRAAEMPNRNPKLTAFSGIIKCGHCGCSVSRRTSRAGKKWTCNTKERKHTCDCRDIYESELESMAVKALGLEAYDEGIAKNRIRKIVIDNAEVLFILYNGSKRIPRTFGRFSGFSTKLFCGKCGQMLESDTWRSKKVWVCSECHKKAINDQLVRTAAKSILGEKNYEGVFARDIRRADVYEDRIEFHFKDGKEITWQIK